MLGFINTNKEENKWLNKDYLRDKCNIDANGGLRVINIKTYVSGFDKQLKRLAEVRKQIEDRKKKQTEESAKTANGDC